MNLKELIKDEIEAINNYKKAIEECNDEKCKQVYEIILKEEEKHLEMLNGLLGFDNDNDFEFWD